MRQDDMRPRILIIDDDDSLLESYMECLGEEFQVHTARTGAAGLALLSHQDISVLLLEVRLPDIDGLEVLRRVKAIDETVDVVMITVVQNVRIVVEAIRLGGHDYLVKPVEVDQVLSLLRRTIKHRTSRREGLGWRSEAPYPCTSREIIGQSPIMRQIYDFISRIANTNATILIAGESGVGKELIARAIHQQSQRRHRPFVSVNCAAISEHLIESEFFGHERGAFTGAVEQRLGKFERADTGVLFLDEIGSLPLNPQAKLLRVLQEREFERVGGSKTLRVDVRVLVSTNQDLRQMIANHTFRGDLFYRLNVVPIQVPPLRQRREDIALLIEHFLTWYNQAFQRRVRGFTPDALAVLTDYYWPGNVRELENVVAHMVAISPRSTIEVTDLPPELVAGKRKIVEDLFAQGNNLRQAKAEFERHYVLCALEQSRWHQTEAARCLGIHRNTLLSKMKALRIRSTVPRNLPLYPTGE
ncbi:Regulatory protein AtoC [Candidatus Entotheonellaceae bacterium PAL068K]